MQQISVHSHPRKARPGTEPSPDTLLTSASVRDIVGGVSAMCLWRWQRDARVAFPAPSAKINGRNYWKLADLRAWQERQTTKTAA